MKMQSVEAQGWSLLPTSGEKGELPEGMASEDVGCSGNEE